MSTTELIGVRHHSPVANFIFQGFLQLTHSVSFTLIRMHINEPGDVEWLERLKVK